MFAKQEKSKQLAQERVYVSKWLNLKNSAHWHDELEIIYCQTGRCYISVEEQKITLLDGECVLVEGGKIHHIQTDENSICIVLLIDENLLAPVVKGRRLKEYKLLSPPNVPAVYERINTELKEKREFSSVIADAAALTLVAEIFRTEETEQKTDEPKNSRHALLKNLLEEIETNYRFSTFQEIAKKFGYSPSHFSRLFANLTGITYTKYLTAVRIGHAVEFLQEQNKLSVTEISELCGFESIRNFNRYFKVFTGYTPKSLPKDFVFSQNTFRVYLDDFNPTEKSSVLL